ncbi:hypothetical protein KK083_27825 [Fulvivirgaceae bacterium PWU4]|uniref:Lipocalin-like domain-containing protein n=1 Tax=Chryseosolibacter histidini TaxID=2782349 RepID=A0AAP2GLS1_9BACT|nr:hypothetical protein [Chryseosolibacter histidini]MBT1700731.1 hypothetical protein [Chryseosolibacter histidini]
MNPNVRKSIIFTGWMIVLGSFSFGVRAQSIVGSWQLVKQSNCMEENMTAANDTAQRMIEDMKEMGSPSAQVVVFKEKMAGEESTRILTKKKTSNNKNFLYRFDGETLMILDKKSQTISNSYMVDKFSADSLIISNSSRPCETRIFLRLK